jgi:DNA gyrase/topoisomerase IV subunit A
MNNAWSTQMNTYFVDATVCSGYGSSAKAKTIRLMVIAESTRDFLKQLTRYCEAVRIGLGKPRVELPTEVVRQIARLRPDTEIEGVEVVEGVLEYTGEIQTVRDSITLFTSSLEGDIDEVIETLNNERKEIKWKFPSARKMRLEETPSRYSDDNEWAIAFERDEYPFESQIRITAEKLRRAEDKARKEEEFERLRRELGKD